MRQCILFLLLAGSAIPAGAQDSGDDDRQARRAARAEQSDNGRQRAERSGRREVREQVPRQAQVERRQFEQQPNDGPAPAVRERVQQTRNETARQQGDLARGERIERFQQRQIERQAQGDESRSARAERFRQRQLEASQQLESGGLVRRQSRIRTIPTTTPEVGQQGPVRPDVQVVARHDRTDRHRWTGQWRDDRRYDWRRHRHHHRSIFRIGFYYDPFGYGYSRFGIGSYLYPNYYRSSFWINDPWQYRLPPAYGPYRWVRYHNDAVLIDTWTGEVVDVIYSFFW